MLYTPEDAPGYRSTVHHGPLQLITIWMAPYQAVVYNILVAIFMIFMLTWRWFVLGALLHLSLMIMCWYDYHFGVCLWRSLKYPRFLGAE